jgi:galactitol-specific phosphotransferase system IIC component
MNLAKLRNFAVGAFLGASAAQLVPYAFNQPPTLALLGASVVLLISGLISYVIYSLRLIGEQLREADVDVETGQRARDD